MTEPKSSTPEVEAILANEELVNKLAAKILDAMQPQPQAVTCTTCSPDEENKKAWMQFWKTKLHTLEMEIEEGLAESAADEYILTGDELDQVVTEIKTSDAYTEKLSRADLSQAVGKVLADNELMRRKGSMMGGHSPAPTSFSSPTPPAACTPFSPNALCMTCSPSNSLGTGGFFGGCLPCSPNDNSSVSPSCVACSPNNRGISEFICTPCSPNNNFPFAPDCVVCSPNNRNIGGFDCSPCSPNQAGTAWSQLPCLPCSPSNNQAAAHSIRCLICGPNNSHSSGFVCNICGPHNGFAGAPNIPPVCNSAGPKWDIPTPPQGTFESTRSIQPPAISSPAPAPCSPLAPSSGCLPCSPNQPMNFPGIPNTPPPNCIPCSPNQLINFPGVPNTPPDCLPCAPSQSGTFPGVPDSPPCLPCAPNQTASSPGTPNNPCSPCAPNNNQPVTHSIQCPVCSPNNNSISGFGCISCGPTQPSLPGTPNNPHCHSCGPFFDGLFALACRAGHDIPGTIPRWEDWRQPVTRRF